jgi:NAD(P)-dependent dehydrogenase (short-subunit alcohol dehydrogenase family)
MDVTDPASVAEAFAEIAGISGSAPDVVVNNAGAAQTKAALDLTEEDWTGIIDLNLGGVFRVAQAAGRQMKASGKGGSIVNVASILGLREARGLSSYIASKAAVIHLSKALALEWAPYRIRVNVLAPGYVETELNRDFFASPAGGKMIERIPARALGQMEDLDGPMRLLCSEASSHMTGSVVVVDGGHLVNSL